MTRTFNTTHCCQHCGKSSTAETDFGRWMRNNPALDSVEPGIIRTDLDHVVLRCKTSYEEKPRDFQLMMIIEAKENGREPDPAQVDVLSFISQGLRKPARNIHQKKRRGGVATLELKSSFSNRLVRVRFFGVYLLQFENTSPLNGWIKWQRKPIDENTLTGLLAFERHPDYPSKNMIEFLRDRHDKRRALELFPMEAA